MCLQIIGATSQVLKGLYLWKTSLGEWSTRESDALPLMMDGNTRGRFYKIQHSDFRFRNQSANRERADLTNQRAAFLLSAPNLNLKSEF